MMKMTYAVAIDRAIAGDIDEEVIERLEALKGQLAKRGSKAGPTKAQKEGLALKERILAMLQGDEDGLTATEVATAMGVTCQKVSPQLTRLVEEGKLVKEKEGKKVRFKAV